MATDYYQMGLGLGSAYSEGKEEARMRKRQEENDARIKKDWEDRQTVFKQGQADRSELDAAAAAPSYGLQPASPTEGMVDPHAEDAPAPPPLPAQGGLPARFGAAPSVAEGKGVQPKTDPKMATLQQAVMVGRANRHLDKGASLMAAQNAMVNHIQAMEDGAQAKMVLAASDEDLQPLYAHINQHSKTLMAKPMLDAKGKPTGYTALSIVDASGNVKDTKVSRADLAKVAVAQRKLERGDLTGIEDMRSVSKDLAAAVASEMGMIEKVSSQNNQATHFSNQDSIARDNTAAKLEIAAMRADTAALRLQFAKAGKEMSAEDATKLNELSVAASNATTPAEYQKAVGEFKRMQAVVMGKMGKVVNIHEQGPAKEPAGIKVNADGSVIKDNVLYVPDPKKPGEFKAAGGLGQSPLDKAIAAHLAGGGKEPAPAPISPAAGLPKPPVNRLAAMSDSDLAAVARDINNPAHIPAEQMLAERARARREAAGGDDPTLSPF